MHRQTFEATKRLASPPARLSLGGFSQAPTRGRRRRRPLVSLIQLFAAPKRQSRLERERRHRPASSGHGELDGTGFVRGSGKPRGDSRFGQHEAEDVAAEVGAPFSSTSVVLTNGLLSRSSLEGKVRVAQCRAAWDSETGTEPLRPGGGVGAAYTRAPHPEGSTW